MGYIERALTALYLLMSYNPLIKTTIEQLEHHAFDFFCSDHLLIPIHRVVGVLDQLYQEEEVMAEVFTRGENFYGTPCEDEVIDPKLCSIVTDIDGNLAISLATFRYRSLEVWLLCEYLTFLRLCRSLRLKKLRAATSRARFQDENRGQGLEIR